MYWKNDHSTANPASLTIIKMPEFGTAVVTNLGQVEYFPPAGFSGDDCF